MPKILKATLGIAFSSPMFRLSTYSGQLADELLKLRGKSVPDEYFATVGRDQQNSTLSLFSNDKGVFFNISQADITYTHDLYSSEEDFSFDAFFKQLQAIWTTTNNILKLPTITRIGYVTEQRYILGSKSNNLLIEKLTSLKPNGFPARFLLTYDERFNAGHGGLPDPTKDDFINIIRSYYDSSLDIHHPEQNAINANLDVQRYFSPHFSGTPFDEIMKLMKEYEKAAANFSSDWEQMGTNYAKAT